MPQLLVRNVPEAVVSALKRQATRNGRSVEAEHRALLEQTLAHESRTRGEAWWRETNDFREKLKGRAFTPAQDLIRESRDER